MSDMAGALGGNITGGGAAWGYDLKQCKRGPPCGGDESEGVEEAREGAVRMPRRVSGQRELQVLGP